MAENLQSQSSIYDPPTMKKRRWNTFGGGGFWEFLMVTKVMCAGDVLYRTGRTANQTLGGQWFTRSFIFYFEAFFVLFFSF